MKDALVKEVERKLVAKRESCGDSEELETIQSWAKEEFRKIREMKQIEVDTMRRLVDKLNWQQIALKTLPRYTGNQCYLHYVNNEVPWRVKRFGKIETAKLKAAVAKHGTKGKWIEIAKEVHKDATPFQCLQEHMRFVKATRSRLPWTKEEDDVLRESVKMFGTVCSSVFEREAREFNFHYSITQITQSFNNSNHSKTQARRIGVTSLTYLDFRIEIHITAC